MGPGEPVEIRRRIAVAVCTGTSGARSQGSGLAAVARASGAARLPILPPRHLVALAAFNTRTGKVLGKTAARHTSAEFVAFLSDIVVHQPRGKEIDVIADNLSAHKTALVAEFLERHPRVHLHFTPKYSSWLNQIELWFGKIERDVIARGVFTSIPDLKRKLMKYIRHYNKTPKTVKWRYFDPTRRITPSPIVTVH